MRQRLNQTFHVRLKRGVDTHVSKIVHPRVGDTYFVADFYLHPEKIKPGVWKAQVSFAFFLQTAAINLQIL